MSSIRLVPNFAWRYPQTPSAEERRAAYVMLHGFHMYLPEGIEREAYSAYLQHNPVQPHLGSRSALTKWADNCILNCCRNDDDVRRRERRRNEAVKKRQTRQLMTLGVLVAAFGIAYGAHKL
jgi:hypothetical protein